MSQTRRLLALAAYPERSAATRFRLTAMIPYWRAAGWEVAFEPFVDDQFLSGFYDKGNRLQKASRLAAYTARRVITGISARDFDAVFVQREAAFVGPAYTESILYGLKRTPIVFDFDDAIWHYDLPRSTHPIAAQLLKNPSKCWNTMRRASRVIAGSSYLGERAREVNASVDVVPTVVSAAEWTPLAGRANGAAKGKGPMRIGWVGSHSTAHQLELVEPALRQLRAEGFQFEVHVIGAADGFALDSVDVVTRPWRLDTEVAEFQSIDIGLAPMHEQPVYQGKCGFKQIQYMAVGVPFVSSFVGGAKDFVVDGENGLVARSTDDWYRGIRALLESQSLRARLSAAGRELVESSYCLERQGPRVVKCLEEAVANGRAA